MMTSSNGSIFRVTGHLCGEFTGRRWIPSTKARDAELWCFRRSALNKRLSKPWYGWWFETPSCSLWRHCNVGCRSKWICKCIAKILPIHWKMFFYSDTVMQYSWGNNHVIKTLTAYMNVTAWATSNTKFVHIRCQAGRVYEETFPPIQCRFLLPVPRHSVITIPCLVLVWYGCEMKSPYTVRCTVALHQTPTIDTP